MDNVFEQVEKNIDNLVLESVDWTASASKEELEAARKGELHLHFWNGKVPEEWMKGIKGKSVLCLAGAGGLQAPLFACAGAKVTVIDLSGRMLEKDREIAEREKLDIEIMKGNSQTRNDRFYTVIFMLYHGTILSALKVVKANSKSHTSGKMVAYFTEDKCYALVCCRSRSENFVTMSLNKDGKQHYYERFPNQLKTLYSGKRGYIYIPDDLDGLQNTKAHTWESEKNVPVQRYEVIPDVYTEILKEEKNGNIIIHRYSEIDPAEQKMHANYIKAHIDDEGKEMKRFYLSHFSSLWD